MAFGKGGFGGSKKGGAAPAASTKLKLGSKPGAQGKVKGISTPFSNRIMSGGGKR